MSEQEGFRPTGGRAKSGRCTLCGVRAKLTKAHVPPKAAGIPAERVDDYLGAVNLLPNLQLLAGTANIEKQDALPFNWIEAAFPSEEKRATYIAENDLDELPLSLGEFSQFFERRKQRIRARLIAALGATPAPAKADQA